MFRLENPGIFQQVVTDAIKTTQQNRAFDEARIKSTINAISKAVMRIQTQGEFMDYQAENDRLVIWSQSSNFVYELGPDGRHGCQAELNGALCWHRVAKRLLALYNAASMAAFASQAVAEQSDATGKPKTSILEALELEQSPYLKRSAQTREFIGGVWI